MRNWTLKATEFAALAHMGQRRKYDGTPYLWHPIRVAMTVAKYVDDEEMIAAALLHDVIEDTPVTYDELVVAFNTRIADLVLELTNIAVRSDGNRMTRRAIDKDFTAKASPEAKTIRLADVYDNLSDILTAPAGFAKLYMSEKKELLTVLTEGNSELFDKVANQIAQFELTNGLT